MCRSAAKSFPVEVAFHVKRIMDDVEPAYLNKTINRFHQEIKVTTVETLGCIAKSLIKLARLDETNENRIGLEAFADIMVGLRNIMPTFMQDETEVTFARLLVSLMQHEFVLKGKAILQSHKSGSPKLSLFEDMSFILSFLGHLAARRLMGVKVIEVILQDLLFCPLQDYQPDESLIFAACEMLSCVGHVIDKVKKGDVKMTYFLTKLTELADTRCDSLGLIYSDAVREAVAALQEARSQGWLARGGSKVVLQFEVVSKTEAAELFASLQADLKLSVEQMQQSAASSPVEEAVQHIRISNMVSGQTMAIILSQTVDLIEGQDLKKAVAGVMCVHIDRLALFSADGSMMECRAAGPSELLK